MAPGSFLTGYYPSGSFYPDNLEHRGNAGVIRRSSLWRKFATELRPGVREAEIQADAFEEPLSSRCNYLRSCATKCRRPALRLHLSRVRAPQR
jgi:hypothetical protein